MIPSDRPDLLPDDLPQQPRREYVSQQTQLQKCYTDYADETIPIVQRVRAGHRYIAIGAAIGEKSDPEKAEKFRTFLRQWSPPGIRFATAVNADRLPIYQIDIDGTQGKSSHSVPLGANDAAVRMIDEQRHESYFNTTLVIIVEMMHEWLVELGVLLEKPEPLSLKFSFGQLAEDDDNASDEDDGDGD